MQELLIASPETLTIGRPAWSRHRRIAEAWMTIEARWTARRDIVPRGIEAIVLALSFNRPIVHRRGRWRRIDRLRVRTPRQ